MSEKTSALNQPWLTLLEGEAATVLRTLPAQSVNCCVTSPPYWGLRDYGIEPSVWDGDPDHAHVWEDVLETSETNYVDRRRWQHTRNGRDEEAPPEKRVGWRRSTVLHGRHCPCGAWQGTLGLEPTPEMYVAHVVDVFREVRRVLRDDGTLWLNLGDSYNAYNGNRGTESPYAGHRGEKGEPMFPSGHGLMAKGLKPKDLVGIPWSVAFALRADGWWLRSDIIWSKPNPMPESVTDRPTKAHEYVFLLSKAGSYYYDAEAIKEPVTAETMERMQYGFKDRYADAVDAGVRLPGGFDEGTSRNKRSVWEIATRPYAEAHFATFPTSLVQPCVLAGSPAGGVVLDPFLGSGTTALVATELGRRAIGIELNPAYLELARKRCLQVTVWEAGREG